MPIMDENYGENGNLAIKELEKTSVFHTYFLENSFIEIFLENNLRKL